MEKINAKKSLGQNFLNDENILKKIADSFSLSSDDFLVEIGPGMGSLTKYLVQKPSFLLCYELDNRMEEYLSSFESSCCKVIFADFLECNLKRDIVSDGRIYVIANIPYYITTPIIEHILFSGLVVSGMTLLVQKEVALRFSAKPGSRDYGYFTVLLRHFFDIKVLFDVPPSCFSPRPNVMSSVVQFTLKDKVIDLDIKSFQSFLKQCFSFKRKTLKNNLKGYDFDKIMSILEQYGFNESVRAEELSYEIFVDIFCILM